MTAARVTAGTPVITPGDTIDELFPAVRHQRRFHLGEISWPSSADEVDLYRRTLDTIAWPRPTFEGSVTPAAALDEVDTTLLPHHAGPWWFVRRWNRRLDEYELARDAIREVMVFTAGADPKWTQYVEVGTSFAEPVSQPFDIWWEAGFAQQPIIGGTTLVVHRHAPDVFVGWETEENEPAFAALRSPAFRVFTELRDWLNLSAHEATTLVGVGRTTPNAWEREGREPRPRQARRLYQLHGLVGTLVRRLGRDEARLWLQQGDPARWRLMEDEDISMFANAVETVAMGPPRPPRHLGGSEIADDPNAARVLPGGTRRRVTVRPRRR